MTIKVHPDGSIEVSTMEEALELQRRIRGNRQVIPPRQSKVNGSELSFDHEIFAKLRQYNGQVVNSETMKQILGAENTGGVGPKLYHMKNRIPGLAQVLHERKDDNRHTTWKVKFP
jgi:hypothetical protein